MPKLADKLKNVKMQTAPKEPLWLGPEDDSDAGGITQSMLGGFLACRERFRIRVIEGLQQPETFRPAIEYGNLWHACEEALGAGQNWELALTVYTQKLIQRYPLQQEQVVQWYHICRGQYPIYVEYWAKHKDVANRQHVAAEHKFKVPYSLPSGRTVYLRGKMDGVDIVTANRKKRTWLQENKTKGTPDEAEIQANLHADLQSNFYLIALREAPEFAETLAKAPLEGVRYNVIRRPLGGGKHSIRQHQPTKSNPTGETKQQFYDRLAGLIAGEPEFFFMRWNAIVPNDVLTLFERRVLVPILEQLCDWYTHVVNCLRQDISPFVEYVHNPETPGDATDYTSHIHWLHPYGVYNITNEGGRSEVDEYILNGSTVGLARAASLFPELQDDQ